jgi:hypothetical protein
MKQLKIGDLNKYLSSKNQTELIGQGSIRIMQNISECKGILCSKYGP